jgi:hypothetical protein
MGSPDPYFGYTTGGNTELIADRRLARHTGDDITHYPPPGQNTTLPDPTGSFGPSDTIEVIHKRIMALDPDAVQRLSDQWIRIVFVLNDISTLVRRTAMDLRNGGEDGHGRGWVGKGADAFLARGPGATLKSLDDWTSAARINWLGVEQLATAIITYQAKMSALWGQYKSAMANVATQFSVQVWRGPAVHPFHSVDDVPPDMRDTFFSFVRSQEAQWSAQAQSLQSQMAKDVWSVMSEDLGGGTSTVYEGPTDAVQANMAFVTAHSPFGVPSIGQPPALSAPGLSPPPRLAPPPVARPTPPSRPGPTRPPATPAPRVPAPAPAPPGLGSVPVVVPPVLSTAAGLGDGSGLGVGANGPGMPGAGQGVGRLLSDVRTRTGPSVLRAAGLDPARSLPPSLPQPPRSSLRVPPNVDDQQPARPTPNAARNDGGSGDAQRQPPGTPSGLTDLFRTVTNPAAPPVLRAPGATPPSERRPNGAGPGGGPRRASPPPNPLTAPPVLERPQRAQPDDGQPVHTPPPTSADGFPSPPPTVSSPVLGRAAATPLADEVPVAATEHGLVRGRRPGASGFSNELSSRRKGRRSRKSKVDEEYEKVRKLLDEEGAWTVETPGGGVLDNATTQPATPAAEPKPVVGA